MRNPDPVATELYVNHLRETRPESATAYRPPPAREKWKMFLAAGLLHMSGADKSVLVCLIDHANPRTGRCDPSEATIAAETNLPKRTVERSIGRLRMVGCLARQRRWRGSNTYQIDWAALSSVFHSYKRRIETETRRKRTTGRQRDPP